LASSANIIPSRDPTKIILSKYRGGASIEVSVLNSQFKSPDFEREYKLPLLEPINMLSPQTTGDDFMISPVLKSP